MKTKAVIISVIAVAAILIVWLIYILPKPAQSKVPVELSPSTLPVNDDGLIEVILPQIYLGGKM